MKVQLDLRALAALRIALGLVVLLDVLLRARDLEVFYTDAGALPRATLLQIPHPTFLNLYLTVGSSAGAAFFMVLLALSATGLALGWRTRWCAVATWALHIAVKHRNPLVLDVGDLELGLVLFWAIFLPLAARWSMDARSNPEWSELPERYASVATAGYLLQIGLIYLMGFINKNDPVWRVSGQALADVLSMDKFATDFGRSLLAHPELLRKLTFGVLALELAIPLLLWTTWRPLRTLACALIALVQLGIAATLDLGLIPLISVLVTLGLWPGAAFSWLGRLRLPESGARGDCPGYRLARITQVFLVLIGVYVIHLNYALTQTFTVPTPIKLFGYFTRQQQDWTMFAPAPGREDGWYLVRGQLEDGTRVDLLRGGAADEKKPRQLFFNQRWRCWMLNLSNRRDPLVNQSFCAYLARRWDAYHPAGPRVRQVELLYLSEAGPETLYDYRPREPKASAGRPAPSQSGGAPVPGRGGDPPAP